MIAGDRPVIHHTRQQAADGGTNVTVADNPATGTVTVAGAHGSAIGSQAANGENSTVAGTQAVHAGRDSAAAGYDTTVTGVADQSGKEGWWAQLRKRGMIVAFAAIIGAIAAVGGTIVGACVWLGWTPHDRARSPSAAARADHRAGMLASGGQRALLSETRVRARRRPLAARPRQSCAARRAMAEEMPRI